MKSQKNNYGFYTFFKEDGLYYFQFNDKEGEAILFSHGYQTEKSRDNGIQAVIRNVSDDKHYEIKKVPKGSYLFFLKAGNHQELARSRKFATKHIMQKTIKTLKEVNKDVPVFDTLPAPDQEKMVHPQIEKAFEKEKVQKIPRHKFSIIYYPDSEVWKILHDLTGDSKQFKTCNGQLIEEFLVQRVSEIKPEQAKPKKPTVKGIATKKEKQIQVALELKLFNTEGKEIDDFAKIDQFHEMEILLKEDIPPQASQAYDAKVMIRTFEGNQVSIIGKVNNQVPKDSRILIPLDITRNLMPGMYWLTAMIHQKDGEKIAYNYEGEKLIMLN